MNKALEIFSTRLRQLREENSLSQEAMAERIGISRVSIVNYESGKRTPDIEVVARVSRAFDVSSDYLVGLSDFRNAKMVDELSGSYKELEQSLNGLFPVDAERIADSISQIIYYSQTDFIAGYVLSAFLPILDELERIVQIFSIAVDNHVSDMEAFHKENPIHVDSRAAADGYGCDPEVLESELETSKTLQRGYFAVLSSSAVGEVSSIISKLLKDLNEALPGAFDKAYYENKPNFQ